MVKYFSTYPGVYAVVMVGSLARDKAVEGSCIDLIIFLEKRQFAALASTLKSRSEAYSRMGGKICFFEGELEGGVQFGDVRVDLGFTDGRFEPHSSNSFDITRDEFETTIGNILAYSIPLHEKGDQFQKLRQKYLPFYNDKLGKTRLAGAKEEFKHKIWKTKWLSERGEHIAALDTLLETQRIFLQYLFIKERKYPIDYTKWIEEQCSKILQNPSLYQELASTINGITLNRESITEKTNILEKLFLKYEQKAK